jgi:hypothetical protein
VAVTVPVAVANDADLYESTAPNHRDGVRIVVAEVEVLQPEGLSLVASPRHLRVTKQPLQTPANTAT